MWFYGVGCPQITFIKVDFQLLPSMSLLHILKLQEKFPSLANTLLRSHLGLWSWGSSLQQFGLFMPMAHAPLRCPYFPCLTHVIGPYSYYWLLVKAYIGLYCSLNQIESGKRIRRQYTMCILFSTLYLTSHVTLGRHFLYLTWPLSFLMYDEEIWLERLSSSKTQGKNCLYAYLQSVFAE